MCHGLAELHYSGKHSVPRPEQKKQQGHGMVHQRISKYNSLEPLSKIVINPRKYVFFLDIVVYLFYIYIFVQIIQTTVYPYQFILSS
jgi:hypothetical protein